MNKLLNFIANIPLYFGTFLYTISTFISEFGLWLHIKFNTPMGKRALEAKKYINRVITELESLKKTSSVQVVGKNDRP